MEKLSTWPVLVFATSDKAASKRILQARRDGQLREIAPRVHTSDLTSDPAAIIRRHFVFVLGHLFPDAILSHRSGVEAQPTADGHIFLTYKYTKKITLPGLVVHLLEGRRASKRVGQ